MIKGLLLKFSIPFTLRLILQKNKINLPQYFTVDKQAILGENNEIIIVKSPKKTVKTAIIDHFRIDIIIFSELIFIIFSN